MVPLTSKVSVFLLLALVSSPGQIAPVAKAASPVADQGAKQQTNSAPIEEFKMPDPVPIPAMSPEELPAGAPRISYRDGKLFVDADNAMLGEILNSIGKEIGAQIEKPATADNERVAAHLSGPPARVIGALLDDGKFGYIILSPSQQPDRVQRVILTTQTQDPVRPAMAARKAVISSLVAAPHTEPGPTPEYQPNVNGSTDTVAQVPVPVAQPEQLQENIAHAVGQVAAALAEAQLPSDSSGAGNTAQPSPKPDAAAQSGGKSPMQVLQDLYQVRQQLQSQGNQSQKPSQNQ